MHCQGHLVLTSRVPLSALFSIASLSFFRRISRIVTLTSLSRQHLQKLRKKEGTQAGDGASAGGTTPKAAATPKTPRKRAPAKPKNGVKTPTSKGKRKATESVAEDDDASDGSQPAPIKKAKAEPGVDDAME